jgi:hypothetical protein
MGTFNLPDTSRSDPEPLPMTCENVPVHIVSTGPLSTHGITHTET